MAAVRDDFSGRKDRKTSKNLRQEYTNLINMDEGLIEARRWIERVTFTPFKSSDFRESLVDGVLLCELVVNVASMSIGRINRSSTEYASADNLKLFQRACETLGFDRSQLFDITDLQEVPVKRGQSVFERAKESQRRLAKVALTIYWLGKYANDNLDFTGSSRLNETTFQHLLENQFLELPDIEGEESQHRRETAEAAVQQAEHKQSIKDKHEIVTEAVDYGTKIQTFKQLEEESKKVQEETERQRRRSFSSSDKENQYIEEEKERRRKSIGSKPVWKEGDSRYKHKKEILGGWKDPIKSRRDRIIQGTGESPPKESRPVGLNMRSPGDMRDKLSRYEQMNRQASEESEVIQGKRSRPKSWGGGDLLSRGGSLSDKTNKFESLQRQADKERAVLHGELRMPAVDNDVKRQNRTPVLSAGAVNLKDKHSKYEELDKAAHQQTMVLEGKHRDMENDFEYDIGDKVSGPISLPGATDVKLREKKRQFESLDYKAQRESSILKLHSGKSFDDSTQRPKPAQPRPKSNVFDYQRFPLEEPEKSGGESIQVREMNFMESSPYEQNEVPMENELPPAPPRGDSLRYSSLTKRPEESIRKEVKGKTAPYSSFAQPEEPKEGATKRPAMKYKEFVSYPVTKQRDRVERYNAALQQLSKEPERKPIEQSSGRPRKKSIGNDEWIKVKPVEEPVDDIPKKPIQKLWDREPEDEGDQSYKKQTLPVDTSFDAVEKSTYVPDVKNMRYKDFAAPPPKNVVKDHVVTSSTSVTVESSGPRKISGTTTGPYSNFAQQANQDPKKPAQKTSMSYRDFVVPPPKGDASSQSDKVKAKKVKDLTKRFTELEAEQFKPKESGPPQLKSLVDREELVRNERESRARSWYGGPLGLDDEEFEGAFRRRVRRWSDYEYEEEDKTKSSPWEQKDAEQYDAIQSQKQPDAIPASANQYQSYNGSIEPEIEVRKKPQVESSREWYQAQPPEIEVRKKPQVESSREYYQPQPPEIEVRNKPQKESSREWHQLQPTADYPPRPVEPPKEPEPVPYGQTYEQDVKPVTSTLQHSEPEAPRLEDQPPSRDEYDNKPPTSTHIRNIGTRSWNEFESSRRKKSMELLDSRPTARPYEPKEQEKGKGETDLYKLKRPAEYLPKHKAEHAHPKPPSQPAYQEPPKPAVETYHHYFQSNTQDDFAPPEKHPQSQPERYEEKPMPTSYPTYYQPHVEEQYPKNVAHTEVVQTGKPLIVSAKLHDERQDQRPVHRPLPGDQAYEFVATAETPNVVESTPLNREAAPKTDFKAQQRLWEDLSSHKHVHPGEEPEETLPVKEPQVEKYVSVQPEMPKPQKVETREDVVAAATKSKRPQVFAIVGRQGSQVRPVVTEMPEEAAVSPKLLKEDIPPLVTKEEPRAVQDQTRQQQSGKIMISPSLSGAKVFNFENENKRNALQSHPHSEKRTIPTKKETVVVETVSVVEQSRGADEDIFKALEDYEDEKFKRNMQNPEYREKLRKEVEEKNRKQREEARYLTNLQMRQSLGTKDLVDDEEGRVRQEYFEGVQNAGGNLDDMYDYNANQTGDYYEKKGERYYGEPRNRPEQRQYEYDRRDQDRREYEEKERRRQEQDRREWERKEQERLEHQRREQERRERERQEQERREWERQEQERREREQKELEMQEQERREWERKEQERLENERRQEQERKERERQDQERREWERQEQERREREQKERERQEQERREWERKEQERLEHQRREQERREREQKDRERKEQERREWDRREQERLEYERRKKERIERERREQERLEYEQEQGRIERERQEQERREWERKEQERIEHERREQERQEKERREWERKEQERIERERQEQERREWERKEQERIERERQEQERREWERKEQERIERERQEQERLEWERKEQERIEIERREQERQEQERREWERKEQERIERERQEQERREWERHEQERLEHERREQERREREQMERERRAEEERQEHERREREKLEHERVEQQLLEQERMKEERRRQEQLERENTRYEQDRRRQEEQRQRGRYGPREQERRHDPRDTQRRHEYRDEERYDPRDTQRRHEYRDEERYGPRDTQRRHEYRDHDPRDRESHNYRDREHYERERIQRDRREQERLDQERRERERRERHRREQENLTPEERERHRLEQQRRVHEMVEQQQREEEEYRKSLSREDHHIHSVGYKEKRESASNWTKIDDGSRYSIYETFIAADQKRVVCTSCGQPINKDTAVFVQELNRYWHKKCFRCVVCQAIFGTKEQRSPLVVSNSLLHCENCSITNEGEKLTEV